MLKHCVISLRLSLQVGHGYFEMVKIRTLFLNKGCYQSKIVQSFTKPSNWNIIQTRLQITIFLFRCLEDERASNWNVWILACKTVYCELDQKEWNDFWILSFVLAGNNIYSNMFIISNYLKTGVNGVWMWLFEWAIVNRF